MIRSGIGYDVHQLAKGEKVGIINEKNDSNRDIDLREGAQNYFIEFESKKITK